MDIPQKPTDTTTPKGDTPQATPVAPSSQEKISEYEHELSSYRSELVTLQKKRAELSIAIDKEFVEVSALDELLSPIFEHERTILLVLKEVSEKEHAAETPDIRRQYEKERWQHIGEWYAVEQEKWDAEEKLHAQKDAFEQDKRTHTELGAREVELKALITKVENEEEREKLQLAFNTIDASRIDVENKLYAMQEIHTKAVARFDTIRQTEEGIEKKEAGVEELIPVAKSLAEERMLSEQRYTLEKERHDVEESRWKIEDEIATIDGSVVEQQKTLEDIKQKENEIKKKIAELPVVK